MNKQPKPQTPDKWQIEEDARTIIRAQEILNDPTRRGLAVTQLKKQKAAADMALQHATAVKDIGKELKKVFGGK
jgi:F0F1-type ATP synthase membrane subunit b/b'